MKQRFLFGCLFFYSVFASAQTNSSLQVAPDSIPALPDSLYTDSTDSISYVERLNTYISLVQYKEAIQLIDSLNLSDKKIVLQKAFCYQSLGNFRKAIEILMLLKEENPEDVPIRLQLILCHESINEYTKGIEILEELILLHPENTYLKVRKGDMLYRNDNPQAALSVYSEVEEYDPVYLNKRIGMCFEKTAQADSAEVYYAKAWEADPQDSFSALSLVKSQLKRKEYDKALANTDAFLETTPDNLQMKILNAYSYYSLSNYQEAIARFEKCKELGDSSLIVLRGLGISYFFMEADSLAYPNLVQAYETDTTNTIVLHALAKVASAIEDYPLAAQSYQTLLERISVESATYFAYYKGLADAQCALEDYNEAVSNYLMSLRYCSNLECNMNLNYTIASISENNLQDIVTAVFYYNHYLNYLNSYKFLLEQEEKTPPEVLEDVVFRIEELKTQEPTINFGN